MELVRVCKKRQYETYQEAYCFKSASDSSIDIYFCDICKAYHLTSKPVEKDPKRMWKIFR